MSESSLKASRDSTFDVSGIKTGGRRMSSGSVRCMSTVSGSKYLNHDQRGELEEGRVRLKGDAQYPFYSRLDWLHQLVGDDGDQEVEQVCPAFHHGNAQLELTVAEACVLLVV